MLCLLTKVIKKDYLYDMKRVNLFYLLTIFLLFASCERCIIPGGGYEHNLLIYIAADNNLSEVARENMNDIITHASVPAGHALVVFTDIKNQGAFLIGVSTRNKVIKLDTLKRYGAVNSMLPEVMGQAIEDAREEYPAKTYGMLFWSHGTGWLPRGLYGEVPQYPVKPTSVASPFEYDIYDPAYPRTKTFGQDGASEMEIPDMVTVLQKYHHEYICFDACLMADMKTYYQLREVCDYIMGSPAEIIDTGYPYNKLTSVLFPYEGLSSLTALCDAYFEKYNSQTGYNRSGTISLVKTEHIQSLAQAFRTLIRNGGIDPEDVDRTGLQTYDRLTEHVFWDIDQMALMLGNTSDYAHFRTELDKTVIYKKTTENFITIPITHFSGLAAYLPTSALPRTQTAFRTTSWNRFLEWLPLSD